MPSSNKNSSSRSTSGRSVKSFSSANKSTKSATATGTPTAYRQCNSTFCCKINSFRTLMNQTKGPAKQGRPTPSTLNTFANWINKGAVIQTCSATQVAKWARSANKTFNPRNCSTTACKNVLGAKFGKSAIKAVARTKTGSFMVATSPVVKGRTFNFPK